MPGTTMKHDTLPGAFTVVILLGVMTAAVVTWIGIRDLLRAINQHWPGWFALQ